MNKKSVEITASTDLSVIFLDFELQVILTEVFYLPRFLWEIQINSPGDICQHLKMPIEKVLDKLRKIYNRLPAYLGEASGNTSKGSNQTRSIHCGELIEPGQMRDRLVEDLLDSKVPLIIFGEDHSQVFSIAMYLSEEGAPVSGYFVLK